MFRVCKGERDRLDNPKEILIDDEAGNTYMDMTRMAWIGMIDLWMRG